MPEMAIHQSFPSQFLHGLGGRNHPLEVIQDEFFPAVFIGNAD